MGGCGVLLLIGGVLVVIATGNEWVLYLLGIGIIAPFIFGIAVSLGAQPAGEATPHYYAPGDGPGFERYVQQRLTQAGYFVRNTGAGSDFGVDLLATRNGQTVAIQTKNYAKPVGVRAVQEVNAGKAYHRADEAWVVSRSGFTHQAKTLAKATNVRLVDVNNL